MTGANLLIPTDLQPGATIADRAAILHMTLAGQTMGTNWSASWFAVPGLDPETVRCAFEQLFAEMIASMSPWEPQSLISRFNSLAAGGTIAVDEAFEQVLGLALDVAEASNGCLDPTLGGEVIRRGFGPRSIALADAEHLAGPPAWATLDLDRGRLRQAGAVRLDLSAVAKGYAVDRMGGVLRALGVRQYLVEIGGEFASGGVKPDRSPWWIDLEDPWQQGALWRLALAGQALATSGDYRQYRIDNADRLSHIVPPGSRACVHGDLACVSVIAGSCAEADAWATALFASGDEQGLDLAETYGLNALFQYRDAPARMSSGLERMAE